MANEQGQYSGGQATRAIAEIRAHGDVKTKVGVIWFVAVVCCLLIIGGFTVFFVKPDSAKDVWVIIGPIISAAISGTVGFAAGERSQRSDG